MRKFLKWHYGQCIILHDECDVKLAESERMYQIALKAINRQGGEIESLYQQISHLQNLLEPKPKRELLDLHDKKEGS